MSYAIHAKRRAMRAFALGGVYLSKTRHFQGGTDLSSQYMARAHHLAQRRAKQDLHENRPDDKEAHQPNTDAAPDEGNNEPRVSGARLSEMAQLANGPEV